jgi:hypothetical protein
MENAMRVSLALTGLPVFALLLLSTFAQPALAQFGPVTWGNVGGYGGWGAYTDRQAMAQDARLASQSRTMGQNAVVQSGIRSTLEEQSQNRTQNYLNQRQEMKDWWFQNQQQQVAARQARAGTRSTMPASLVSFETPTDVEFIKWPTLLQDPIFTRQRARIEEPYLRNPQGPSVQDYRNMVDAVAQMKGLLDQKLAYGYGIPAEQSWEANKFLDQLGKEAATYAEQLEAAPRRAATPAKTSVTPPAGNR